MAIPLAGLAVGYVGSHALSTFVTPHLTPSRRAEEELANRRNPNVVAPPGMIIHAWSVGRLPWDEYTTLMGCHGMNVGLLRGDAVERRYAANWTRIIEAGKPAPDISQALHLYSHGYIGYGAFLDAAKRAGTNAWEWEYTVPALWQIPSLGDVILARNRGLYTAEEWEDRLRWMGFGRRKDRTVLDQLRTQYPPISDLLRFSHKEAFQPEVAGPLGFYNEYPARLEPYMAYFGLGGGPGFRIQRDGVEVNATWLDLYNAAEWMPISPTQSYEMLHRLRPSRIPRYLAQGFDLRDSAGQPKPFLIEDVRRWLRIADYPQPIRDYLAAIAYGPLRLVDITSSLTLALRRLEKPQAERGPEISGLGNTLASARQWAVEQFLDRGLHPDDANTVADLQIAKLQYANDAPARNADRNVRVQAIRETIRGYDLGYIERAHAAAFLQDFGMSSGRITAQLNVVDARHAHTSASEAIKAARREYLSGALNRAQTIELLQRAGITTRRAGEYVRRWDFQFSYKRRAFETSKIIALYKEGLIVYPAALLRLTNLRWERGDALLLLAEANLGIARAQAAQLERADRTKEQRAKQLQLVAKQLASEARRIQREIGRLTPIATIERWAKKGKVSAAWARRRLTSMGYTPDVIALYLSEWYPNGNGRSGGNPPAAQAPPAVPPAGPGR